MMSLRDIKRQARRDLHSNMLVPALYILTPSADPIPVTVRIWSKWEPLGELPRTLMYAERQESVPQIIFMRDEIILPKRGAIVSVEAGEAYRIDNVLMPDDITIITEVTILSATDAADLPVPAP